MSAAKVSPALQMRRAARDSADAAAVERLYLRAFADNARVSLERFWDAKEVEKELYALYNKDGEFCGFMQLLTLRRLTHILYFAIEEQKRGAGLGGEALSLLLRKKPGNVLLADIELPLADAKNYTQRRLRKQFYLNNGFAATEIRYAWRGEEYEILSAGGSVTKEEFDRFWQYFHKRARAAAHARHECREASYGIS